MNKWEVSRRDLLKQLGVGAACLPLLHAGLSRAAGGTGKHLFIIAATEGYRQSNWLPPVGALGATLPKTCTDLAPLKDYLIFLPNMKNPAFTGCDRCGHGAYGTVYYGLAPRAGTGEYAEPNGPTVDQVIANKLGKPSLNMGTQTDLPPSNGGPGHNHCFWRGAQQPLNPELDPLVTYGHLFTGATKPPATGGGSTGPDPAVARMMAQKKSILDYVGASLTKFAKRLGSDDRSIIE